MAIFGCKTYRIILNVHSMGVQIANLSKKIHHMYGSLNGGLAQNRNFRSAGLFYRVKTIMQSRLLLGQNTQVLLLKKSFTNQVQVKQLCRVRSLPRLYLHHRQCWCCQLKLIPFQINLILNIYTSSKQRTILVARKTT